MYAASLDHCIIDGCDRPRDVRGLCNPCYMLALKMIRAGKTTWEELEQRQLCLAARKTAPTSPLRVALEQSREAEVEAVAEPQGELFERAVAAKAPAKKSRTKAARAKAKK